MYDRTELKKELKKELINMFNHVLFCTDIFYEDSEAPINCVDVFELDEALNIETKYAHREMCDSYHLYEFKLTVDLLQAVHRCIVAYYVFSGIVENSDRYPYFVDSATIEHGEDVIISGLGQILMFNFPKKDDGDGVLRRYSFDESPPFNRIVTIIRGYMAKALIQSPKAHISFLPESAFAFLNSILNGAYKNKFEAATESKLLKNPLIHSTRFSMVSHLDRTLMFWFDAYKHLDFVKENGGVMYKDINYSDIDRLLKSPALGGQFADIKNVRVKYSKFKMPASYRTELKQNLHTLSIGVKENEWPTSND